MAPPEAYVDGSNNKEEAAAQQQETVDKAAAMLAALEINKVGSGVACYVVFLKAGLHGSCCMGPGRARRGVCVLGMEHAATQQLQVLCRQPHVYFAARNMATGVGSSRPTLPSASSQPCKLLAFGHRRRSPRAPSWCTHPTLQLWPTSSSKGRQRTSSSCKALLCLVWRDGWAHSCVVGLSNNSKNKGPVQGDTAATSLCVSVHVLSCAQAAVAGNQRGSVQLPAANTVLIHGVGDYINHITNMGVHSCTQHAHTPVALWSCP